jgi:hypothetical protein
MKRIILLATAVVVTVFCSTALAAKEDSLTDEQQAKLAEIEKYIEQHKQNIENHYAAKQSIADEQLSRRLAILEAGDNHKVLTGGFFGWSIYLDEVLQLGGVDMSKDKEYSRLTAEFHGHRLPSIQRLNLTPRMLAIEKCRLAEEVFRLRLQYATNKVQTENQKKYAIDVRLADLEAKLKDNVINPPKPIPDGVVTGIVYSKDKPAAIVGSQVVHPGENIGKVRIKAISPDSVQFEKNGKQWTQGVGDVAGSEW